jgi:hypothetical protein
VIALSSEGNLFAPLAIFRAVAIKFTVAAWVGSLVLSRTVIKPLIVLSVLPFLDRNSKTASDEDIKIRSRSKNNAPTLVIPAKMQKSAQTDFNAT